LRCGESACAFLSRGGGGGGVFGCADLESSATFGFGAMHIVRTESPKTRILMGAAGLFLAACGIAAVLDYIVPGWFWRIFIVLTVVLLGLFGKVVYDGRAR